MINLAVWIVVPLGWLVMFGRRAWRQGKTGYFVAVSPYGIYLRTFEHGDRILEWGLIEGVTLKSLRHGKSWIDLALSGGESLQLNATPGSFMQKRDFVNRVKKRLKAAN